jgi:hypothetical protein
MGSAISRWPALLDRGRIRRAPHYAPEPSGVRRPSHLRDTHFHDETPETRGAVAADPNARSAPAGLMPPLGRLRSAEELTGRRNRAYSRRGKAERSRQGRWWMSCGSTRDRPRSLGLRPFGRMTQFDHVVCVPSRRTQLSVVVAPDFAPISSRASRGYGSVGSKCRCADDRGDAQLTSRGQHLHHAGGGRGASDPGVDRDRCELPARTSVASGNPASEHAGRPGLSLRGSGWEGADGLPPWSPLFPTLIDPCHVAGKRCSAAVLHGHWQEAIELPIGPGSQDLLIEVTGAGERGLGVLLRSRRRRLLPRRPFAAAHRGPGRAPSHPNLNRTAKTDSSGGQSTNGAWPAERRIRLEVRRIDRVV